MSKFYAMYTPATGRIKYILQCPEGTLVKGPDEDAMELSSSVDPDAWYVRQGTLVPRPVLPITVVGHTLTGVPPGAELIIEDSLYSADGQAIELEFSLPGSYPVRITHWPYLDWETVIEN